MTTHAHKAGEFGNLGKLATNTKDKKLNAYNHGTNANTVSERMKRGLHENTSSNHFAAAKLHSDAGRAHMAAFKAGHGDVHEKLAATHRKRAAFHKLSAIGVGNKDVKVTH